MEFTLPNSATRSHQTPSLPALAGIPIRGKCRLTRQSLRTHRSEASINTVRSSTVLLAIVSELSFLRPTQNWSRPGWLIPKANGCLLLPVKELCAFQDSNQDSTR